ncbi:MAG: CBS domain-containing protein [Bacteroidota bacterium]
MIAREFISDTVPSVKSTDAAGRALDWMNEFKVSQLPIVDEGRYIGMVTEDDILETTDLSLSIAQIRVGGWESAAIYEDKHIYEAIRIMSTLKLEVLAVLDTNDLFQGIITIRDVLNFLEKLFSIQEPGGVMVVEIPQNGYVLSEIGRIVESTDAKILSLYLSSKPDDSGFIATLKLNVEDLSRVVASFERFDYHVIETFHRTPQLIDYQKNLDALLNYLDM